MNQYLPTDDEPDEAMGEESKEPVEEMDEDELIAVLSGLEDDAKSYVYGGLADAREQALKEYYQIPEDTEDNGLSTFVTSDTQDTIEWVLPTITKMFVGGEHAVEFNPREPQDEAGAEQATEAANYVFYQQNNGFLVLHTAFKDALMMRNGAVTWRYETKRVVDKQKFRNISGDELTYTLQQLEAQGEVEITHAEQTLDEMGQPAYTVHVRIVKQKGSIRVENVPPDHLLIQRDWHTPLLAECPYVCIREQVTLSDLREMGYDVESTDLNTDSEESDEARFRAEMSGDYGQDVTSKDNRNDEAMQMGTLRREWVLVDFDGDGIAERRYIVRLADKILENEECSHVPVAAGVPIIRQHRWDGLSLADIVSDIQQLNTEVTRQMLNGLAFSVTPRYRVLADLAGNPQANVDDMLNFTPGGYVREKVAGAVQPMDSTWVGAQAFPMLEYIGRMRQDRTGVNQYFQGNSTDALNKTASGTAMLTQQTQMRVELIARVLAETLVVPMFQGIFKLLLEYQMEPLAFRLAGKFVKMDPQEWRDQYDMSINVGLGTGNKDQMLAHLMRIQGVQLQAMQLGIQGQNGPMVTAQNLYAVADKIGKNSGFTTTEQFFNDPGEMVPPQPPPPPPEIVKTQMTLQADAQKSQAEQDFEAKKMMAQQRHEVEMARLEAELKAQLDAHSKATASQLQIEADDARDVRDFQRTQAEGSLATKDDLMSMAELVREVSRPKKVRIVRDANGRATGAEVEPEQEEPQPDPLAGQGGIPRTDGLGSEGMGPLG